MIVGLGRKALDALEANSLAKAPAALRPRDAASVILLRRQSAGLTVLLGKRRADLAFMPNQFVFPGGRVDPADRQAAAGGALQSTDARRLDSGMGAKATARRVHALAAAALRECYEETGLMLGHPLAGALKPESLPFLPDHSALRYVARAITPTGRVRRFDTRFFAAFAENQAHLHPAGPPDAEFSELRWAKFDEALALDCPAITKTIIGALADRLAADPQLTADMPIPEFRMRHGRFVCEWR
jgi:8-oxo-dGTP pyrophosphatase MutT (NUDIX family)